MIARRLQPNDVLSRDLELRHLPLQVHFDLTQLLDCNNSWREIMARVPKQESVPSTEPSRFYKYSALDIKTIEKAAVQQHRSCTEIFLSEWSTSGRRRPTLDNLLELLTNAQLFRAADYVAQLLGEGAPSRPAETPAAPIDVSDEAIAELIARRENENNLASGNIPDDLPVMEGSPAVEDSLAMEAILQDTSPLEEIVPPETGVLPYRYRLLELLTNRFNSDEMVETPSGPIKRRLGSGGFGSVFLARLLTGEYIAVKKLHVVGDIPISPSQFRFEVKTLSQIRQENLLSLVGYSNDGPACCLLYEYLDGGNLQVRLANKEDPLPWLKRIQIAECVAKGLDHMHTAPGGPYIHRDVKSANILLSSTGHVKLGDFGLIRWGPKIDATRSISTSNIVGSTPYMAEEAFRGDISPKMDTFSYGVVLMELMTALPPHDESREDTNLIYYFDTKCSNSLEPLLDHSAGEWPTGLIDEMFRLIKDCVNEKRSRPYMTHVNQRISDILRKHTN